MSTFCEKYPDHTFILPQRSLQSIDALPQFFESKWCVKTGQFLMDTVAAVRGQFNDVDISPSENVKKIEAFLLESASWIDSIPPIVQNQRFGNQAFRQWHRKMVQMSLSFCKDLVQNSDLSANQKSQEPLLVSSTLAEQDNTITASNIVEGTDAALSYPPTSTSFLRRIGTDIEVTQNVGQVQQAAAYEELHCLWIECFGNASRIDYGTGHELAFTGMSAFMREIGILQEEDLKAYVIVIFNAYLTLVRKLQQVYWLEPAGSKGAWGLDDYQFLCFLYGASQFAGQDDCLSVGDLYENKAELQKLDSKSIFASSVNFICRLKTGSLSVHSPILYSLGRTASWDRAVLGLSKLYSGEVLSKFPVVRHLLFGSLLSFDKDTSVDMPTFIAKMHIPLEVYHPSTL